MKKTLFIIPGFGENTNSIPYRQIAKNAHEKGYVVIKKHPNWKKPLSEQKFPVQSSDVVFGFSLGAVLAYMIAQDYPCKRIILASMTPFSLFPTNALREVVGKKIIDDLLNMSSGKPSADIVQLYGDKENIKTGIIIPNTGHELTDRYIKEIERFI